MSNEFIVAACSLVGTLIGSLAGIMTANRMAVYRIEQLEKKVDRHNAMVERTALLERDNKTIFRYIDELRADAKKRREA